MKKLQLFKNSTYKIVLFIFFSLIALQDTQAQLLGTFNVCPQGGCTVIAQRTRRVTAQPVYATFDSLTLSTVTFGTQCPAALYPFANWGTAHTIDAARYVQFSIKPNSTNWGLILDSLEFDIARSSVGPLNALVSHNRSGAFLTDTLRVPSINIISSCGNTSKRTWNLNSMVINQGDSIIFRFYGRGASNGTTGNLSLNNIRLYGKVNNVLYRSNVANGNWTTAADWENNSIPAYTTATIAPSTDANVTIRPNNTISRASSLVVGTDCNTLIDSGNLIVTGNITINAGDTLQNYGRVSLTGNWIQNGTYTGVNDTLDLNGSVSQTISGVTTASNFLLNNAAGASITSGVNNALNITKLYTHTAGTLTTNGNLNLKATSAEQYAQVNRTGTGTISGNLTAEYIIPGGGFGFRSLSSPLNGATLSQLSDDMAINFGTPNSSYATVFNFDETRSAPRWAVPAGSTSSMNDSCFSVFLGWTGSFPINIDITGTYRGTSDYTRTGLTRTGSVADTSGWHFIRNPWPSGFLWDGTIANIQGNQAWVYNQNGGTVIPVLFDNISTGVIPPFSTIIAQVTSNGVDVTLPNNKRNIDSLKNYFDKTIPVDNYIAVKVSNLQNNFSDEVRWHTHPEAQADFDRFDGVKFMGGATEIPTMYFNLNGVKLNKHVWAGIPTNNTRIPLYFKTKQNSVFALNFTQENFDPNTLVFLLDTKNNKKHNIKNGTYTFTHDSTDIATRFELIFENKTTALNIEEPIANNVQVGSYKNIVFVNAENSNQNLQIEIYDIMGRQIVAPTPVQFVNNIYTLTLHQVNQGYYIVRVWGDTTLQTSKVYIH